MKDYFKVNGYKILHISRQGSKNGGAAAFRTHKALVEAGYQSDMLLKCSYDDPGTKKMLSSFQVNCSRLKKKVLSYFPKRDEGFRADPHYYFFGVDEELQLFDTNQVLKKFSFQPDIIIIYFMDEFLNFKNIHEIQAATNAKIFLYPMDMGQITGGCHYSWDCIGYKNTCLSCPAILKEEDKNRASINLLLKKKYIDLINPTLLAASQWLMENISESYLFKDKKAYKLLLPVDSDIFRPYSKAKARNRFDLDVNKKTIFFGAQFMRDKRKGLAQLLKSLQILAHLIAGTKLENNIQLLIAGRKDKDFFTHLPFEYQFLGLIDNEKELPMAYSAADIYVCPSLQDAGPMMVNESLMCGTPVVSFDMGVAKDIVVSNKTGYKASLNDCEDLARGMLQILSKEGNEYQQLSNECRKSALSLYSTDSLVSRFEDILLKDYEIYNKSVVI